jgi:SAM-dependent methyltransferase
MDLRDLQANWDTFGRVDPMWAILTDTSKRGRRWDRAEFFETGRDEIQGLMDYVSAFQIPRERNTALDFGCGIGRLTQNLCEYFERVVGVDIAPSMIAEAHECNRHGDRCAYLVNGRDDLSVLPGGAFDLVYCNIVLQHMRPEYSRRYIREFVRLLTPGGVAVFQIPGENRGGHAVCFQSPDLPGSACQAEITPDSECLTLEPGEPFTVRAKVVNRGDTTWPAALPKDIRPVRLGNHWRDAAGNVLVFDDGRVGLPASLPPGGETVIAISVTAPRNPGHYVMELDMVQEYVTWFEQHGSKPARVTVEVKPADPIAAAVAGVGTTDGDAGEPAGPSCTIPVMEMYGVPLLHVIQDVTGAGGVVVDVREDVSAGYEWSSYRYCVARRA